MTQIPEKRRFVRYDVRAEVQLEHQGQRHSCETDDLGAGGCRISVPWRLEKGSGVELTLGTGSAAVRGRASVAWITPTAPWRVGLVFSDDLAAGATRFIQRLLGSVKIRTDDR